MTLDGQTPPQGTVRDWLDQRADTDGIAVVFPETGEELTWPDLRDEARAIAQSLTAKGVGKSESVAVVSPERVSCTLRSRPMRSPPVTR